MLPHHFFIFSGWKAEETKEEEENVKKSKSSKDEHEARARMAKTTKVADCGAARKAANSSSEISGQSVARKLRLWLYRGFDCLCALLCYV